MEVILGKLHLVPDAVTGGIELTAEGTSAAEQVFPKLVERACIVCPSTGWWAPRGIEGVVDHMFRVHSAQFWGWQKTAGDEWWVLQG